MSGGPSNTTQAVSDAAVALVCDRMLTAALGENWRQRAPEHVTAFWMDEVRAALQEVANALAQQPAAVGEEIMVNAAHDVFTLPLRPSELSSGPRFVVHVPAPEQQPAAPSAPEGVSEVTRQLIERDAAGRQKYGATLDRADLSHADWLQHMAEELLDAAGYALAAKREALSQQPAAVDRARFRKAPCYLCGYNGAGYFQPETHPCAALYHAAQHQEPTTPP